MCALSLKRQVFCPALVFLFLSNVFRQLHQIMAMDLILTAFPSQSNNRRSAVAPDLLARIQSRPLLQSGARRTHVDPGVSVSDVALHLRDEHVFWSFMGLGILFRSGRNKQNANTDTFKRGKWGQISAVLTPQVHFKRVAPPFFTIEKK